MTSSGLDISLYSSQQKSKNDSGASPITPMSTSFASVLSLDEPKSITFVNLYFFAYFNIRSLSFLDIIVFYVSLTLYLDFVFGRSYYRIDVRVIDSIFERRGKSLVRCRLHEHVRVRARLRTACNDSSMKWRNQAYELHNHLYLTLQSTSPAPTPSQKLTEQRRGNSAAADTQPSRPPLVTFPSVQHRWYRQQPSSQPQVPRSNHPHFPLPPPS